ncbi:MAG: TMEM175 family protein [Actinobacteria bacterium]|nr:TMEM175 family protein [Actinomycetota bacterium]
MGPVSEPNPGTEATTSRSVSDDEQGEVVRPVMTTGRLEAFSDGVFAIAATLLILSVRVSGSPLGPAIIHSWPGIAGYAVSFLSIGVMWVNHHLVMHQIARVDRTLLMINTVLLLLVAFVPFPTQLLAEHLRGADALAAALFYGATLTVIAVFFNLLWLYAAIGRRLLEKNADPSAVRGITRSYLPGPWVYLAATMIAFASPLASAVLFAVIAAFYMIESTIFAGRRRSGRKRMG